MIHIETQKLDEYRGFILMFLKSRHIFCFAVTINYPPRKDCIELILNRLIVNYLHNTICSTYFYSRIVFVFYIDGGISACQLSTVEMAYKKSDV